ncbi:MAG: nuclear transport factor 2 family protein [Deltaproteobacteria bacterium]
MALTWRLALTLLLGAQPGCGAPLHASPPSVAARARADTEVAGVLDDWHAAAARADEAAYFAHFDPDGVFLGTDATERWSVEAFRAYAHPHFARGRAWAFHAVRRHVTLGGDGRTAWFDETLETGSLGPARGSGVLRRGDDGVWRIAQYNLSITIPNERFDAVRRALAQPAVP